MGYSPRVPRVTTLTVPGVLAVGATSARWYNQTGVPIVISGIAVSVGTAPTGAAIIVDVNLGGTTVFTNQANRPQIADGAFASTTVVPSVGAVPVGGYLTVDVDQIGSTIAGADLVVQVMF